MAKKKATPTPEAEAALMEQTPDTGSLPVDNADPPVEPADADTPDQSDPDAPGEMPLPPDETGEEPSPESEPLEEDFSVPDTVPEESALPEADHPDEDDMAEESDDTAYESLLQELGDHPLSDGTGETSDPDSVTEADVLFLTNEEEPAADEGEENEEPTAPSPQRARSNMSAAEIRRRERILTIDAKAELQTEKEREATLWHEVQNAYRTRRILTGTLDGVEQLESGLTLAVVNYKGFRVAIPMKEMLIYPGRFPNKSKYPGLMDRLNRMLSARLGAEMDFIVKGIHNESRSIVASRRDAMYRKRQTFYLDTDELGEHMIYEGRVVQARVIAVAQKVLRVEVFGVECTILARDLSWEWMGNARDHYSVGDRILVRVLRIEGTNVEDLAVQVDVRSVSSSTSHDNLKKCVPQGRYAGRITDVRNGVVFIRLNNGVNAIAHSCYDLRTPGKKDDVSFAVTRLDEEQGVAVGIITRIIKQNL